MGQCREMYKHEREESKRDRQQDVKHVFSMETEKQEGAASETLLKQDVLCVGKYNSITTLTLSRFHLYVIF